MPGELEDLTSYESSKAVLISTVTAWAFAKIFKDWALTKDKSIKHLSMCITLKEEIKGSLLVLQECQFTETKQVKSWNIVNIKTFIVFYNRYFPVLQKWSHVDGALKYLYQDLCIDSSHYESKGLSVEPCDFSSTSQRWNFYINKNTWCVRSPALTQFDH